LTADYSEVHSISEPEVRPPHACLAWLPTGHAIATNAQANTVVIVDVDSRTVTHTLEHAATVRDVRSTRGGQLVVATTESLDIWDLSTKERIHSLPEPFSEIEVNEVGTFVAAADGKNNVALINPHTGLLIARIVALGNVNDLAFSPDGLTLAVGATRPAKVSLWDTRTRQELMKLDCNFHLLNGLAFSPDGRRLVATGRNALDSSENGSISEWSIRDSQ